MIPLQYQDMDVGEAEPFAALNNSLWLFEIEVQPVAVLFSQHVDRFTETRFAQVEIATLPEPASLRFTRAFLSAVQEVGRNSTLYRGKVLSFEAGSDYSGMQADMRVHRLPPVPGEAVILDAVTMARLDRHVFAFDRHREGLKRLGQSTRKGLLLYGPPGTGKTHASSATSPRIERRWVFRRLRRLREWSHDEAYPTLFVLRFASGRSGWFGSTRASTVRNGPRSARSRPRSVAWARRCATGCARPNATEAFGQGRPRTSASGSRCQNSFEH